jgi:hypothetical protein
MRLSALKHLVESVFALAKSERVTVLGSASLLASAPQFGEPGGPLETTFDADLLVEPCDEQLAAMIHEAVGEGSLFAQRTGYHADLLRASITETLPPLWTERLVPLPGAAHALALAPEDLLVVKLRVGRTKDLALCTAVLNAKLVSETALRAHLEVMPLDERELFSVYRRLEEALRSQDKN